VTRSRIWLVGLFLFAAASAAQAERIGIAAIVNDEVITTEDVAERRALLMATNNIPQTPETIARFTPRVVQSLVDERIEMQEARRLSIKVGEAEMNAALRQMEESRRVPAGSLEDSLKSQNLSLRSMKAQIEAQIAWNKMVQRKLRREVSISQDEIARAQQAAAADPGVPQVRLAAVSIIVPKPEMEAKQSAFAQQISEELKNGKTLADLAPQLAAREDVRLSPPAWVEEEKLQPALQQALRAMQPGEASPPLKSMNTFQLIQLLDRRVAKKVPDATEVLLKEMVLQVPAKPDQKTLLELRSSADQVMANPGDCSSETIGATVPAKVSFTRMIFGKMPNELKPVIADLSVTQTSKPILTSAGLRMYMLCERIDPGQGNLPPVAEVRRQLFNEKIDLEAQKHLRNLKRDAFIEIKGSKQAGDA
jgi:peptidyl-prolyl cis-trans isomerase SurA